MRCAGCDWRGDGPCARHSGRPADRSALASGRHCSTGRAPRPARLTITGPALPKVRLDTLEVIGEQPWAPAAAVRVAWAELHQDGLAENRRRARVGETLHRWSHCDDRFDARHNRRPCRPPRRACRHVRRRTARRGRCPEQDARPRVRHGAHIRGLREGRRRHRNRHGHLAGWWDLAPDTSTNAYAPAHGPTRTSPPDRSPPPEPLIRRPRCRSRRTDRKPAPRPTPLVGAGRSRRSRRSRRYCFRRKEQRTLSRCSKEVRSLTASDGTTGFTPGSTDESRGDDLPGVAMERGSDGCVAL